MYRLSIAKGEIRMGSEVLIRIIILFIFYFLISQFYLKKRLNIHEKPVTPFTKGRKKIYKVIEGTLFLLTIYLFIVVTLSERSDEVPIWIQVLPIPVCYILVSILRGIEQWLTDKESKSYLHEVLGALFFLALLVIVSL